MRVVRGDLHVDVDLAGGGTIALIVPVIVLVHLERIVEVVELSPTAAGAVLGPLVAQKGDLIIIEARGPVLEKLRPDGGDLGLLENGGRVAELGPLISVVLRPETVDGVGARARAELNSHNVVVSGLLLLHLRRLLVAVNLKGEGSGGQESRHNSKGEEDEIEEIGHFLRKT